MIDVQGRAEFRKDYPSHTRAAEAGSAVAEGDCEAAADTVLPPIEGFTSQPRLDMRQDSVPQEAYSPAYSLSVVDQNPSQDINRHSNVSGSLSSLARTTQSMLKDSCKRRSSGVSLNYGGSVSSLRREIDSGNNLSSIPTQPGTFPYIEGIDIPQDLPGPPQLDPKTGMPWSSSFRKHIHKILTQLGISNPHIPVEYWGPVLAVNVVHVGLVIGKKYVTTTLTKEVFFPAECGAMLLTAAGLAVWSNM